MLTLMIKSSFPLFSYYWLSFKKNRRAYFSLIFFVLFFLLGNLSKFIANDKPIFIYQNHQFYFPLFVKYPETAFGGDFQTEAQYQDAYVKNLLKNAFVIWPIIPYSYDTIDWDLTEPAPTPPSFKHWFGTDDQARDVFSRLIYAYQISINFGLLLCFFSLLIGVSIGAIQGFYGGLIDLFGQRIVEIWSGIPLLFLMIILSSFIQPNFWWILIIVLCFSWMEIVGVVRTEFLRGRNRDYIKIARTLNVSDWRIIFTHLLPNAMVSTITYAPFIMAGSIGVLVSLDFLGFGMPVGSASLGELLEQGKNNLTSPHLAIIGFFATCILLAILVFIGEGVRDAFNQGKRDV